MFDLKKAKRSNKMAFFVCVFAVTIICAVSVIYAQSVIVHNRVIILEYETGDFWTVNPVGGERDLLYSFEPELSQILDFEIDPSGRLIYVLEGAGCCGAITAGESLIKRIDLDTENIQSVFFGRNVFDITLAPDGMSLILDYYDAELTSVTAAARDGLAKHCLLRFPEEECTEEIDLLSYDQVDWISANKLIVSSNDSMYLITIDDLNVEELPVYLSQWAINSDTNEVIGTEGMDSNILTIVDLDNFDVTSWMLTESNSQISPLFPLSFSPDGSKIIILDGQDYIVVEFVSGEIITSLSNIFDPRWINNGNIVFSTFEERGSYPGQMIIHDLASQEGYELTNFYQRVGYRIIGMEDRASQN